MYMQFSSLLYSAPYQLALELPASNRVLSSNLLATVGMRLSLEGTTVV